MNGLYENGLLRLLVPVGGRTTPPADICSPMLLMMGHHNAMVSTLTYTRPKPYY